MGKVVPETFCFYVILNMNLSIIPLVFQFIIKNKIYNKMTEVCAYLICVHNLGIVHNPFN